MCVCAGVSSQDVEQMYIMYVNILKYTGSYTLLKVLRINKSYVLYAYIYMLCTYLKVSLRSFDVVII